MTIDARRDPHARIVVRSLPSRDGGSAGRGAAGGAGGRGADGEAAGCRPDDPFIRAENEDDDGYDPYSDRPAPREPLFQEDPWN